MGQEFAHSIVQLRLLVGFLGERAQRGWWPTSYFDKSGRAFLEPVFARTAALAQYHGVVEAARRVHDEHLSLGCFHLFRLREEQEQDLHARLCEGILLPCYSDIVQSEEASIAALDRLAGGASAVPAGPLLVGRIDELEHATQVKSIAKAYLSGFNQHTPVYPYLMAAS